MTEAEWLACTDPQMMLSAVRRRARDRKLRLLATACARCRWEQLTDKRPRRAVDVAERNADGAASRSELRRAGEAARDFLMEYEASDAYLKSEARRDGWIGELGQVYRIALYATSDRKGVGMAGDYGTYALGGQACGYLRCIFGNPFRPVTLSPAWQTPQVMVLAQAAYEERELPAGTLDLARLAVLADALEEAGCTDADILNHCRRPGVHVRGCWVVDLLVGKS